jgi:hypothetical protein
MENCSLAVVCFLFSQTATIVNALPELEPYLPPKFRANYYNYPPHREPSLGNSNALHAGTSTSPLDHSDASFASQTHHIYISLSNFQSLLTYAKAQRATPENPVPPSGDLTRERLRSEGINIGILQRRFNNLLQNRYTTFGDLEEVVLGLVRRRKQILADLRVAKISAKTQKITVHEKALVKLFDELERLAQV